MPMKTLLVLMFVAVLAALAGAGIFMLKKRGDDAAGGRDKRMARALAWRVGLSVAIFLFILLSWHFGWMRPTGIPAGA
jgi:hypothetical protein